MGGGGGGGGGDLLFLEDNQNPYGSRQARNITFNNDFTDNHYLFLWSQVHVSMNFSSHYAW